MKDQVPFFMHELGQKELDSIAQVFQTPILTTGKTVDEFEKEFAAYLGRKRVLGVMSCTAALHLSLIGLGVKPGDEVITTPLTFVATSEAIHNAGARAVFVDVEPDTGNIDASMIEKAITPRTKAIIAVHLYGLLCDMKKIRSIADHHALKVIEDAAHCVEGSRDGVRVGDLADATCFSFFATKAITCGEGGALATDDESLAERVRFLRNHGMNKISADRFRDGYSHWDVFESGWKYNMSNISAAMLLPQLARIDSNRKRREDLYKLYADILADFKEVRLPALRPNSTHAHHLFTVWVNADLRDPLIKALHEQGVTCVVNYRPVHLLTWYRETFGYRVGSFPKAEKIGNETISLPFYPTMPEDGVKWVAKILEATLRKVS